MKVVNLLQNYKFRLNPNLVNQRKIPILKVPLRFRVTPESLVQLSENIVKKLPLPQVFQWTNLDIIKWIENLGFPQYVECFQKNYINGYSLIFIDASVLISMNIHIFNHIKKITNEIRKLYGMEIIRYVKNVSSLIHHPLTHFKLYRGNTGRNYQSTNPIELFRKMKIIRPKLNYDDHWTRLEKWLQHQQSIEFELNIRERKEKSNKFENDILQCLEKSDPEDLLCICYIPPCTCKNSEFQNIKRSSIITKNISINHNDLRSQHNVIQSVPKERTKIIEKSENLSCIFIRGTCIWRKSKSFDPEFSLPVLSKESLKNYSASISDLPAFKIDITKSNAMKIKIK